MVFSLRQLKDIESVTTKGGEKFVCSASKGNVVTAAGNFVGSLKFEEMQDKNVFFVDVDQQKQDLEQRLKMVQLATSMLKHFEHFFKE